MRVSIVTTSFNSARTIGDTLTSINAQQNVDVEHIIKDGGSRDATHDAVREFGGKKVKYESAPDTGIYNAMNQGLRRCSGDIIGFLNSDDYYAADDVLNRVCSIFDEDPDLDIVFGDLVYFRGSSPEVVTRYYDASRWRPWTLRFGWMPPHPATFVRAEFFRKVGPFREDYRISADYEWFVRAFFKHRPKFRHLSAVLVHMRLGGVSTSSMQSVLTLNCEIVRACRSNGVYTNMLMLLLKVPFKLIELKRRPRQTVGSE